MALDASAAGTWRLGDREVNRLGLGAMRLPGTAAFDHGVPRDRQTSIEVVRRAVELGVNHIDTAAFYFSRLRSANEILNAALSGGGSGLAELAKDVVITTKVGPGRDPSGEWVRARPDQLRGQVEENLRQLGRDQLDVVNLRTFGEGPIAEHFGALADLREEGLIVELGVSNVVPQQLADARAIAPVVCVQNRFSLDSQHRASLALLEECGRLDIAFVPFFAIAGEGREHGPSPDGTQAAGVHAVAAAHGVSAAAVRLAWTLHQGRHVLAIPGTGDLAHLEDNVAAAALRLSDADLGLLGG